ncbi:Predicted arabinose efflux permease, MFS family [Rhodospirillales bacterium URHD0017]|nr:Predicted arabinose efflux permease, MFS family [Rhodospirillales bacterium URHD0017]
MEKLKADAAALDSRTAWVVASAALAILTIAYGAPLLSAVALKPIAAEFGTERAAPAAAGAFTLVGAAFGGIAAGWLSGWLGIRRIVLFGAAMIATGLVVSASGGLLHLYVGHGVLMGLFGTSCIFSPVVTYVSRWFERSRGAAVAMISSGQSLAGALWPVLFQTGITEFGWRWTMLVFGLFVGGAILVLAAIFLRPPPEARPLQRGARHDPQAGAPVLGLSPNLAMGILMMAIFCCCIPMAMPSQHIVAFCGDLGFAPQIGAAMLSVLLGCAFLARQFWGWLADRVGGLQTLLWSSLAQATALSGFLLMRDEAALFAVSAAFGLGFSGLLPAYVIAIREFYPVKEANWRVPAMYFAGFLGMAAGGWGAGVLYDQFGYYLPAFAVGIGFNIVNLVILLSLVLRQRSDGLPARALAPADTPEAV